MVTWLKRLWARRPDSYKQVADGLNRFWQVYGGWNALRSSPYLHAACLFTLLSAPLWITTDWWELPLGIIPDLVGFTIGGYAILVAFGDDEFRHFIAGHEDGEDGESPFIEVNGAFLNFIFLQALSLILALLFKAFSFASYHTLHSSDVDYHWAVYLPGMAFSLVSFGIFVYALFCIIAVALNIFRVARWFDQMQTAKKAAAARRNANGGKDDGNTR